MKLNPMDEISEHFSGTLARKTVHIIVLPPLAGEYLWLLSDVIFFNSLLTHP